MHLCTHTEKCCRLLFFMCSYIYAFIFFIEVTKGKIINIFSTCFRKLYHFFDPSPWSFTIELINLKKFFRFIQIFRFIHLFSLYKFMPFFGLRVLSPAHIFNFNFFCLQFIYPETLEIIK